METNHILIVEDDKEIREGVQIYLQSQGYKVFQAADGIEGLEIIEKEEIHLAIVDIMMPRMDGIRMTMKLREKYDFPVIMLSAKSEEVDKITGLNIGADDYVTKPFTPMELMARVNSQLRRYRKFLEKLDSLFVLDTRAEATGFVGDVTGLIGQYAHGNEPSHHVIYLYSMLGRNSRTAELVREVFDRFYQPKPDGLCGNDDCGQMSAWYIFSALGFYPVDSVSGEYVIGAPQLPYFRISLPNGKKLEITADGLSEENMYVESVSLNGVPLDNTITYDQIMQGGKLVYIMTSSPS